MKILLKYLRPYRKKIILIAFLYMFATFCTLLMPTVMSEIVDNGIKEKNLNYVYIMSGVMLGLALLAFFCSAWTAKINSVMSNGIANDLRKGIFEKINNLTFEEFSQIGTSSLLTRATEDVSNLQDVANGMIAAIVSVPILLIGGVVLSLLGDYVLALIMLAIIPVISVIVISFTKKMYSLWQNSDKFCDMQNKVVRERLSGIRVIRAFDKEEFEHERVSYSTNEMAKNIIKANVLGGVINPLSIFLFNLATVIILFVGQIRIKSVATLKAGDIIATLQYIALITNGLLMVFWTLAWLPHIKVCAGRVAEVLNMKGSEIGQSEGKILSGEILLKNVTFSYPDAAKPSLYNIDMEIKNGETVGIIGGTGCGKTTLAKLLMDFYNPDEGEIYLGGKNYTELTKETARDNISIALQKSMIFDGTVKENVEMSESSVSEELLDEVTSAAQIKDFIYSHEEKYGYMLAGGGTNISGGQKQRINIARTILKKASVYIFDDSFSALDYLTESKLRKAVNVFLKNKTQIIITQRVATAMRCDKIYVLDKGRVKGCGTHSELMKSCDIYKEIYRSQLGGDNND